MISRLSSLRMQSVDLQRGSVGAGTSIWFIDWMHSRFLSAVHSGMERGPPPKARSDQSVSGVQEDDVVHCAL